jgi:hypothetical protein
VAYGQAGEWPPPEQDLVSAAQRRRFQGCSQCRWQSSFRWRYHHCMVRHAAQAETYEAQLVKVPKAAYLSTKGSFVM